MNICLPWFELSGCGPLPNGFITMKFENILVLLVFTLNIVVREHYAILPCMMCEALLTFSLALFPRITFRFGGWLQRDFSIG